MAGVSVVIPARNESLNLPSLVVDVLNAMSGHEELEVIVVDDGSRDSTASVVEDMRKQNPQIVLLRHPRSLGQSAAVHSGVLQAKGSIICTLDGDGQNPPAELPKLYARLLEDETGDIGLVAGQRVTRRDTLSKRWASKFANSIRGGLLNDGARDTGCGLKAFRREAFLQLPYFNHMHRFLPALFKRDGWQVVFVDVDHAERQAGQSNYNNLGRGLVGIVDLLGVYWLMRRAKKQPRNGGKS